MDVQIQEMSLDDYNEVYELWQEIDEIILSEIDTRETIARFLERFSLYLRQADYEILEFNNHGGLLLARQCHPDLSPFDYLVSVRIKR